MRTLYTTLALLFLVKSISICQITREGSFVAADPGVYPISGDVLVTYDNGNITVDFASNFSTVQGITLEVFLSKSKDLDTGTDVLISDEPLDSGSNIGTPINGAFTFNVPTGTNLYEFDNVIVQCTSANMLWGHANLCETNLSLDTSDLPSDTYRGELTLQSMSTIPNVTTTNFEAREYVSLLEGFEAETMSDFLAIAGMAYGCIIE